MRPVLSASANGIEGVDVASILRNLAANLRRRMDELGLTQQKLAKALNVSQSAVSEWLSGERLPRNSETWEKLSKVTGMTYDEMVRDPATPERDKDPVVRFIRRQANELGYDLVKKPEI